MAAIGPDGAQMPAWTSIYALDRKPWPHLAPIELSTASGTAPSASGPQQSFGLRLRLVRHTRLRVLRVKAVLAHRIDQTPTACCTGYCASFASSAARLQEVHASHPRRRGSSTWRSLVLVPPPPPPLRPPPPSTSIHHRQIPSVAAWPRFPSLFAQA
ncbi:hypothetical protein M441DRAFT_422557 [Trichoderma asperellum CBS 433.97]|uniref:Uncharacterized protein n=1 Tax=Trichoderma asperellum (strain ATCC 204424 / CBS 433.97 / NBRC 101777) TaxID=1042311 RepID=A0A2T3Z572_TRIA4|nr:hypothetical protein M441DRAFT_422557 [Trichoderma asperellum CBS 433.97]PTB39890.1 hypothetical protein M441DRAFT_422557 [Trichoderma asperellum CBS 433.97]